MILHLIIIMFYTYAENLKDLQSTLERIRKAGAEEFSRTGKLSNADEIKKAVIVLEEEINRLKGLVLAEKQLLYCN